jgi:hypothetical protein
MPTLEWRWHRRRYATRFMHQTSAWARWWIGIDLGWFGIGIVRETWGWRFMFGPWHLTGMDKSTLSK